MIEFAEDFSEEADIQDVIDDMFPDDPNEVTLLDKVTLEHEMTMIKHLAMNRILAGLSQRNPHLMMLGGLLAPRNSDEKIC